MIHSRDSYHLSDLILCPINYLLTKCVESLLCVLHQVHPVLSVVLLLLWERFCAKDPQSQDRRNPALRRVFETGDELSDVMSAAHARRESERNTGEPFHPACFFAFRDSQAGIEVSFFSGSLCFKATLRILRHVAASRP